MIFGIRDIHEFHFAWPWMLLLLLLIPVGWLLYARQEDSRIRRRALYFSYASVVAQLEKQPALWKRLFKPVATSLFAAFLIVGLARPMVVARVPVNSVDMMIVLDISLSMMAEDIKPDRLSSARDAAIQFVESLPDDVRVGLEVFAGDNYVLSPPTRKHGEVVAYLRALRKEDLKQRTEIGSALHTALKILTAQAESAALDQAPRDQTRSESQAPNYTSDVETGAQSLSPSGRGMAPEEANGEQQAASQNEESASGKHKPPDRVIVLLSDGDSHEGYPWDRAAQDAQQAHVSIHTVGIGSPEGSTIVYQGIELPVNFDETTLRQIAGLAGGSYFRVLKEADFRKIYQQIHERTVHYEEQTLDLAFVMAGLGLFLLAGLLLIGFLL